MTFRIAFLPGDGVGPEVAAAARRVMMRAGEVFGVSMKFEEYDFGGVAIDRHGDPLPPETLTECLEADAVFLGAVGGPKWERGGPRPETGLLALRKHLGVYANLRPIRVMPGKETLSPLKEETARGTDILIIRELTGGLYFGEKHEGTERASDNCVYTREEVTRIARIAFEAARARRGKVTSVDKANVMATSRLWRATVIALHETEYPDVELEHVLVDAMAMKLIQRPAGFDVVLTENLFGDILSDEASVIAGSIGLAPSASLGDGARGLYEPIHGSAPDIAGQDKANPAGAILSGAMLMRFSLQREEAARAIERAVEATIEKGFGTGDIGGRDSCSEFAERAAAAVKR
ncbi:MAG TPA: 3-isopropylmalate dehydrogenase [Parvularculaceae bacterium]|nr:3-isopropylmalate dehydrogenase [Parvularculaceae bacterium]HNS86877.1 3-isopropylmalate dehydrogenase [Parvularculaceae bacterium]